MSYIWMRHVTYHMSNITHKCLISVRVLHIWVRVSLSLSTQNSVGWQWLVSSFKDCASFAKEPYKRDLYFLQKSPICFRSLLIVATPYIYVYISIHIQVSYVSGTTTTWRVWVKSHMWMSQVTHMNESCVCIPIFCIYVYIYIYIYIYIHIHTYTYDQYIYSHT